MNNNIITTAAATAVSTITDDLQNNKKVATGKEAHTENDIAANVATDDSDSTSTTTATTDSSLLHTPEVTKTKRSRLKSSLASKHWTRSSKGVQINLEEPQDHLQDGEGNDVINETQE
eukprot:1465827-Ditylum_brightwellii.AAC.1